MELRLVCGGAEENHFLFFGVDAGFGADQFDPLLGVFFGGGGEVVVSGGGEEAEDVVHFAFWVFLTRDCGQFGEVDLVPELGFFFVFVDGEEVWAEDEVDWFPGLGAGEGQCQ